MHCEKLYTKTSNIQLLSHVKFFPSPFQEVKVRASIFLCVFLFNQLSHEGVFWCTKLATLLPDNYNTVGADPFIESKDNNLNINTYLVTIITNIKVTPFCIFW
jgi:hypothetical protein